MYNRYICNERGGYDRIPMPEPSRHDGAPPVPPPAPPPAPPPVPPPAPPPVPPPDASRFLGRVMERLRLQDVDTGDLLLLLILFFLFEEKADDELLIALGLLLIL